MDTFKYPRTKHLPFSPGISRDDKVMSSLEYSLFIQLQNFVKTEKLDGENTTMTRDLVHARSIDSRDHPSRHLVKQLWSTNRLQIPENWHICGENVYAKHSIEYTSLTSPFYVISIWVLDDAEIPWCLSWDDTVGWCNENDFETVPVLWSGKYSKTEFETPPKVSTFGNDVEGYVIRDTSCFSYNDFGNHVGKYVRPNHVTTDQHWSKKWTKNGFK